MQFLKLCIHSQVAIPNSYTYFQYRGVPVSLTAHNIIIIKNPLINFGSNDILIFHIINSV